MNLSFQVQVFPGGLSLPETNCVAESGTPAQGLIHAVAKVTDHRYSFVPLYTHWCAEKVNAIATLYSSSPVAGNSDLLCQANA